jgi:ankyrin repeat protein
MQNGDGETALSWEVEEGHEVVVRLLLEHKADVDASDSSRRMAIYRVNEEEHEAVVRLLLERKAARIQGGHQRDG